MKNQIKITAGTASRNGKAIIYGEDLLDASCDCGINCCEGYIKLPNYNSDSGDATTAALYVVDGELVIGTVESAEIAIKAFKANAFISATSASISGCTPLVNLLEGATRQLTATVLPVGSLQTGVWTTSAGGTATVSVAGLVTAVAAGTATITFTSTDGAFTATCVVTVVGA